MKNKNIIHVGGYTHFSQSRYEEDIKKKYTEEYGEKALYAWSFDISKQTGEMLRAAGLMPGMKVKVLTGGGRELRNYTGVVKKVIYCEIEKYDIKSLTSGNATLVLQQPRTEKAIESIWIERIEILEE